jgi:hypothetical protein
MDPQWRSVDPRRPQTGWHGGRRECPTRRSVALSADGNTGIVGGLYDNGNVGAAWVFAVGEPSVTTNPTNQTVTASLIASFVGDATGTPAPTVEWQVSTDNGISFSDISGATSATYTFLTTASQNGSQYRAMFINGVGVVTSNAATLTVIWPVLSVQKTHEAASLKGRQ